MVGDRMAISVTIEEKAPMAATVMATSASRAVVSLMRTSKAHLGGRCQPPEIGRRRQRSPRYEAQVGGGPRPVVESGCPEWRLMDSSSFSLARRRSFNALGGDTWARGLRQQRCNEGPFRTGGVNSTHRPRLYVVGQGRSSPRESFRRSVEHHVQ
jgi:hypothetical protein